MNKKNAGIVFILLLTGVFAGQALAQGSDIKFNSNASDLTKISGVLEEFRQDIIHKDGYALTKLMLNPDESFGCRTEPQSTNRLCSVTIRAPGETR